MWISLSLINVSALKHIISQAYLMKTKLLLEYLRLRKRPLIETLILILATFALFPDKIC